MALGGAQLDDALDALLDDLDQMDPTPQVVAEQDRTQQIQTTLHRERALLPPDGYGARRGGAAYPARAGTRGQVSSASGVRYTSGHTDAVINPIGV